MRNIIFLFKFLLSFQQKKYFEPTTYFFKSESLSFLSCGMCEITGNNIFFEILDFRNPQNFCNYQNGKLR